MVTYRVVPFLTDRVERRLNGIGFLIEILVHVDFEHSVSMQSDQWTKLASLHYVLNELARDRRGLVFSTSRYPTSDIHQAPGLNERSGCSTQVEIRRDDPGL